MPATILVIRPDAHELILPCGNHGMARHPAPSLTRQPYRVELLVEEVGRA